MSSTGKRPPDGLAQYRPLHLRLQLPTRSDQLEEWLVELQGAGRFAAHPDRAGIEVDLIPIESDDLLSAQAAEQAGHDQTPVIVCRP